MTKLKAWIEAFRLRTLPLALSTILMGTFVAYGQDAFSWRIFFLCILTTLFLQILSNLANDYGDASSGVDSEKRIGPKRTVQQGLIRASEMKYALLVFSLLSFVSGVLLVWFAFKDQFVISFIFILVGLGAIAAAIKYTVGKNPYGYAGFGDLFVFIFFGLVGVGGSYYLYTNSFEWLVLLPASSLGFLSVGVLNVNNIRDIESDKLSGKNSIPVRIGKKRAVTYHWFLLFASITCIVLYTILTPGSFTRWLYLIAVPLILVNGVAVQKKDPAELDPYLRQLAVSTLLLVILFGVGLK